ncbi:unnamed protein product [Arabidopsis lyrata]|nr:unnamed protein product [Arabidopsis lyrata]
MPSTTVSAIPPVRLCRLRKSTCEIYATIQCTLSD